MTFEHPGWFLLAIPLAVALWYWWLPSRLLTGLRLAIFALVLLALCGAALRLPSRAGTVVLVADRSASMPADAPQRQAEAIGLLAESRGSHDRLAVVTFGREAVVELAPGGGTFGGFTAEVDPPGSNLAAAVRRAVALVPEGAPGRLLILSDGRHTGADPAPAAFRAAAREVALDYRLLSRPSADDVAILRVDAPRTVTPEESFLIHAWVRSPVRQTLRFDLARGGARIASGKRTVGSGVTRLTFRTRAGASGTGDYAVRVDTGRPDPVPENNRARAMVGVRGPRPLRLVTETPGGGLSRLLAAGGLNVEPRPPERCGWSVAELSNYAAVLIENVPADDVGDAAMARLAPWVTETGGGLMLTGGKHAYGPGGYYKSPIEPVMPVSMELRKEHRKLALAIVVAMDRSGSMAMEASGGRTKMDLANLAAAEVVGLLSEMDEFGCVAVDSAAHVVAPLEAVTNKGGVQSRIRSVQSMGGGIYVYEALSAAARMLTGAASGTRHIILFADAADAEQPGKYKALLEKCAEANITVSVVGLGTPGDTDADLLRDIAKRGQGRCMFTTRPEELPRLFAQDTFVVARSAFLDEVTPVRAVGAMRMLAGRTFADLPAVGGYNLCYLRPEAQLAAVTRDDYEAPLVAAWNAGAGRVLCYTGEADGAYTGPMGTWPEVGNFLTSLAKWTAGSQDELPGGMLLAQDVGDDLCRVALHLDPDRDAQPFEAVPSVSTLRGRPGKTPETHRGRMRWDDPDTLVLEVPLRGDETALSSVRVPGIGRFTLPPACLPYSAEFKPVEEGRGRDTLDRLARATGGVPRADLPLIWDALPSRPQRVPLVPWLLTAAVGLFLLEVLERRTGLLTAAASQAARLRPRRRRPVEKETAEAEEAAAEPRPAPPERPAQPARPAAEPSSAERDAPTRKAAAPETKADLGSVLRRARHRAGRRTKHKDDG